MSSTPQGRRRGSFADLPADVVRRVFAGAGDEDGAPLSVKDRLRAEATCRAWRRALRGLPFSHLDLGPICLGMEAQWEAQKQWLFLVRPATDCVRVMLHPPELSMQALHTLDRKEFPNVWDFEAWELDWDPAWFEQLRRLKRLVLEDVLLPAAQPAQLCLVLSGFTTLTSLSFCLLTDDPDPPPATSLCVDLATLPSLLELTLSTSGSIELRQPPPGPAASPGRPHGLQRLALHGGLGAAVDFAALPHLTFLHLGKLSELPGAGAIACATALRCLVLGGDTGSVYSAAEGHVLAQPWVLEVLQRAPPALRSLQLYAHWPAAVAETMAGLGQLRVLSLKGMCVPGQGAPAVQPLGDGPVWGHLRALQWLCKAALPEAVCQATRLELLHYCPRGPLTPHDLHLLSSLPVLRRLCIVGPWTRSARKREAGTIEELARRLRHRPHAVALEWSDALVFSEAKTFNEASAKLLR